MTWNDLGISLEAAFSLPWGIQHMLLCWGKEVGMFLILGVCFCCLFLLFVFNGKLGPSAEAQRISEKIKDEYGYSRPLRTHCWIVAIEMIITFLCSSSQSWYLGPGCALNRKDVRCLGNNVETSVASTKQTS